MSDRYHEGERAVQERVGVRAAAERIGGGIHDRIPPAAREFLLARDLAVVAALDEGGRVWASPLVGPPGFLDPVDERRLRLRARPVAGDPLAASLVVGAAVGLVAVEYETRRRIRFNGEVAAVGDGFVELAAEQVYANCPKYIQSRLPPTGAVAQAEPAPARAFARIGPAEAAAIAAADTFYVASIHPTRGADCSHRGGMPGFVRVASATTIVWPDYPGNSMFQTLGNVAADGRLGLLFPDFASGDAVALSGRAEILWDEAPSRPAGGEPRRVRFTVEAGVVLPGALPGGWRLEEYSPFNPRP